MPKRLIVNADDLGLSPGVNRGIVEAHTRGIVTSTTVMINLPDAPSGLEQVAASAPDLGVGLHFNLTHGRPVSPPDQVRSLLDDEGRFYDIRQWPAVYAQFDADELAAELCAQVHRFIQLTGHAPDHLDSHQGVTSIHPVGLRTMLELAAEYSIPVRDPGISLPPERAVETIHRFFPAAPVEAIRALYEQLVSIVAAAPPVRRPDRFCDAFHAEGATLGDLLVILTNLEPGVTEIMCHPGYAQGLTDGYTAPREVELAALTHGSTKEVVASEQIKLITFAAI